MMGDTPGKNYCRVVSMRVYEDQFGALVSRATTLRCTCGEEKGRHGMTKEEQQWPEELGGYKGWSLRERQIYNIGYREGGLNAQADIEVQDD